ncbi:MAG: MBL fold metallo-hydrolase [Candidatus Diapherotrites archaeon]|nr:MBL fold metallo-hydrolase [Candidatus Diapherotrites archaeon]
MKILPIAFDSMGTRSMCTFVKTRDVKILIDPGVALGPSRYGLPPHPIEIKRREEHWQAIVKYAMQADVLIVTHYHYDHYRPDENLEIYENKVVFVKHPEENINKSQKERAAYFLSKIENIAKSIQHADRKEFLFGNTKIKFSQAVFHGTNAKLGYVTEVLIDDGYKLIHTSDVEGPSIANQVEFILENKPNLVILDGPLSYMLGYRYSSKSLQLAVENMIKIVNMGPIETLIVDHHFLRDLKWKQRIASVFGAANRKGIKVLTAAEYAGKPLEMLEAQRKELYEKQP